MIKSNSDVTYVGMSGDVDGVGGGVGEVNGEITFDTKVGRGEGRVGWAGGKNNIFAICKLTGQSESDVFLWIQNCVCTIFQCFSGNIVIGRWEGIGDGMLDTMNIFEFNFEFMWKGDNFIGNFGRLTNQDWASKI